MPETNILWQLQVDQLSKQVEESTRSTKEGTKRFVEPSAGTLSRATSRRHHIVFGRRGSGKSSLLRKAASDLTVDRRPIAYVDLESFKGHSYPDVLISVLIMTFDEFREWLQTAAVHPATKTTFWQKVFGSKPKRPAYNRAEVESLSRRFEHFGKQLENLLHSADDMEISLSTRKDEEATRTGELSSNFDAQFAKVGSRANESESTGLSLERQEKYQHSKTDYLHRHIMEYQRIFRDMAKLSDGDSFLFLDDLYHIRRSDQASVIDYFHRIAKGNNLWLKIGSIRHRTTWYTHGDPPIGLKMGDDADEIDLDLTLEKYGLTKNFLKKILQGFLTEVGDLKIDDILTPGAIDRLVLASGGVTRDFLNIFRRSIDFARERLESRQTHHRGPKIGAEDVNNASGEYEASKREELNRDTLDDRSSLEAAFVEVRDFCLLTANSNVFLVIKDSNEKWSNEIQELVDLRLIHKINSRITVPGRASKIYEAYMLDTSQYLGSRKKKNFPIYDLGQGSNRDEIRKVRFIYKDSKS